MNRKIISAAIASFGLAGLLAGQALADGAPQRPDGFHRGDASGVYIWHRSGVDHGWHLETTDPRGSGPHAYTGTLTTDGKFTDVQLVHPESGDSATIDGNGALNYSFTTYSGIDGVDFRDPGGSEITFSLYEDGSLMATSNINLGDNSHHPASNPFTLQEPAYNGRPDGFRPGDASGVYLWHRAGVFHGWHLATTDPVKTGVHSYTGTVTSDGKIVDVALVRPESGDTASLDGNGTLSYSFNTASGIDGVDFRVDGGTQLTFTLYEDGQLMSTGAINIGDGSVHPASDPFTLNV